MSAPQTSKGGSAVARGVAMFDELRQRVHRTRLIKPGDL